jgi:hypothetical protein
MPSSSDGTRGVSCEDCYFRQELLCALKTKVPCPTFRATVGRARRSSQATMAAPVQAPLIPIPMRSVEVERPVTIPAALARAPHQASEQQPFDSGSSEATFTLREAHTVAAAQPSCETESRVCLPPPRELVFAGPRRAAAAARDDHAGATLVVEVAEEPVGQLSALGPLVDAAPSRRLSRIAERVASRYPSAAPA